MYVFRPQRPAVGGPICGAVQGNRRQRRIESACREDRRPCSQARRQCLPLDRQRPANRVSAAAAASAAAKAGAGSRTGSAADVASSARASARVGPSAGGRSRLRLHLRLRRRFRLRWQRFLRRGGASPSGPPPTEARRPPVDQPPPVAELQHEEETLPAVKPDVAAPLAAARTESQQQRRPWSGRGWARAQGLLHAALRLAISSCLRRRAPTGGEDEDLEADMDLDRRLSEASANAIRLAAAARVARRCAAEGAEQETSAPTCTSSRRRLTMAGSSEVWFFEPEVQEAYHRSLDTKCFDGPSGHKVKRRPSEGWRGSHSPSHEQEDDSDSEDDDDEEETFEDRCDGIAVLMSQQRSSMLWAACW
mmetsp:Transcript_11272/g.30171  ORF Transcript_11272/g.30171 Transcript_11272/m.30171 type:complete len:364 (-) Transcript_11272:267-1358(-)